MKNKIKGTKSHTVIADDPLRVARRFEVLKVVTCKNLEEFIIRFQLKGVFKKEYGMPFEKWRGVIEDMDVMTSLIPYIEKKLPNNQAVYIHFVAKLYVVKILKLNFGISVSTENYMDGNTFVDQLLGGAIGYVKAQRRIKGKKDKRLLYLMEIIEKGFKGINEKYGNKQIAIYFADDLMGMNFIMVDGFVYQLFLSQLMVLCKKFEVELDLENSIAGAVDMFSMFIPLIDETEKKHKKKK